MGENTSIEWCTHTFNPVIGCTKVSEGCKNCYAEEMMDHRYGRAKWGVNGTRARTSADNWKKPLAWNRKAAKLGERHRVFCESLGDVFEDHPAWVEPRRDLLKLIVGTSDLDWLILTKRIENVIGMIESAADYMFWFGDRDVATQWVNWLKHGSDHALPNVWVGASTENQKTFDQRVPELLKIPAKVRFLSMEPLLGPVDFKIVSDVDGHEVVTDSLRGEVSIDGQAHLPCRKIDWVIVGGESGNNARPMHPGWAKSIRDQCVEAGTPFLFKQWGEYIGDFSELSLEQQWQVIDANGAIKSCAVDGFMPIYRLGKHKAGRLLDGREWNQFPV